MPVPPGERYFIQRSNVRGEGPLYWIVDRMKPDKSVGGGGPLADGEDYHDRKSPAMVKRCGALNEADRIECADG